MFGDNMMFWSLIMAAIFVFGGVQVRSGKTDFLGKDMDKDIRPELKKAYCREMSIPMFVLAAVELMMAMEEATGVTISDEDMASLQTVGSIMDYVAAHQG